MNFTQKVYGFASASSLLAMWLDEIRREHSGSPVVIASTEISQSLSTAASTGESIVASVDSMAVKVDRMAEKMDNMTAKVNSLSSKMENVTEGITAAAAAAIGLTIFVGGIYILFFGGDKPPEGGNGDEDTE